MEQELQAIVHGSDYFWSNSMLHEKFVELAPKHELEADEYFLLRHPTTSPVVRAWCTKFNVMIHFF